MSIGATPGTGGVVTLLTDRVTYDVVDAVLDRIDGDPTIGTVDIIRITLDLAPCDACRDGEHTECRRPTATGRDGFEAAHVTACCCPTRMEAA